MVSWSTRLRSQYLWDRLRPKITLECCAHSRHRLSLQSCLQTEPIRAHASLIKNSKYSLSRYLNIYYVYDCQKKCFPDEMIFKRVRGMPAGEYEAVFTYLSARWKPHGVHCIEKRTAVDEFLASEADRRYTPQYRRKMGQWTQTVEQSTDSRQTVEIGIFTFSDGICMLT